MNPDAANRPCDAHPPPSTLGAIWCSLCGAWRPRLHEPLVYIDRTERKPQPFLEGPWVRLEDEPEELDR